MELAGGDDAEFGEYQSKEHCIIAKLTAYILVFAVKVYRGHKLKQVPFRVTFILFNLIVDLLYAWIDPKIRY